MDLGGDLVPVAPRVVPGVDQVQRRQGRVVEQELGFGNAQVAGLDQDPDRDSSPGDPGRTTADARGRFDRPLPEPRGTLLRRARRRDQAQSGQTTLVEQVEQASEFVLGDPGMLGDLRERDAWTKSSKATASAAWSVSSPGRRAARGIRDLAD